MGNTNANTRRLLGAWWIWTTLAGLIIGAALYAASPAKAEPISGCEQIPWGLFGVQRRSICDSVRHPDGGWLRARVITRPAYYSNPTSSCYGGYYSSSCTYYPGGWVDEAVIENTTYIVYDDNVVPGEPGHLQNGFLA